MTGAQPFEAFVRRFQDMVFGTALRLLGNASDAEDVAQTVFLRAFQRFPELQDNPAAAAWLKIVARHACLNHLARYRSRWRFFSELSEPDDAAAFADDRIGPDPAADLILERADVQEQVERALAELPDQQRVPLVLFHFEDLNYNEIAQTLGVSVAKVKTDIHRARRALRKRLADVVR